jgi:hypothetical protein
MLTPTSHFQGSQTISNNEFVDNSVAAKSVSMSDKTKEYVVAGFMDYDPKSAALSAHGKLNSGKKSPQISEDFGTMFSSSPTSTWFVRDL